MDDAEYFPDGYLDDDQLSDYNSDDGIEWLNPLAFHFALNGDLDDDFVIDDWVEQAEEEGWLGTDSDDSDIVYTDGLPVKKIFVTNFQLECTPHDLRTLFSKFGTVTDVSILEGKSSRYAFITFENPEHACLALKASPNELQLRWKRLRVFPAHSWHQPKDPPAPGEQWKRDESEVEGECFIHKLNDDCLLYIFKFLEIKEQMKMERVCKRWQDLSQSMWLRRSDFDLSCLSDKSSHFSVPAFRKVLGICGEHITKLDFCSVKSDNLSAVLPLTTQNCPNLEVLKLAEAPVNRCVLHNLSSKCKNLRCLTLRDCQGLKDYELGRLVSRLDKLEHLDVSKNTAIQGHFLRSIKPDLFSLVLDECNNLSLKHLLSEVSKPHWNVRILSLNSCQTLTSLDVQTLCNSAAPKLKQLRLNEYFPRLNTGSLRALGSLSELTHLSLKFNSCVKKDVILKICEGCLKLEELDISGCVDRDQNLRHADPAIEAVAKLKHLQLLKLNYVMIYDVALEALAKHCKGLRLLECKGCPNITHRGVASVLARCTRLEMLDLSGCYITNEVVTNATLAVGARKERTKLTLYLGGTQVVKADVDDLNQPLLKIILDDRSIRHLRPDFSDDVYFEHYLDGDSDYEVYDDSDESVNEEELQVLLNILAG